MCSEYTYLSILEYSRKNLKIKQLPGCIHCILFILLRNFLEVLRIILNKFFKNFLKNFMIIFLENFLEFLLEIIRKKGTEMVP